MTADFVEGLIDVIHPPVDVEQPAPVVVEEPVKESAPPTAIKPKKEAETKPAESADAPSDAEGAEEISSKAEAAGDVDLEKAFKEALGRASWVRRQDFKVLAIYYEANKRDLGPITAKRGSALGEEIGLTIRHENIRKVVRTRLTEKIETSTVEDSQPPTFQYEINDVGVSFFVDEYLKNL